MESRFGAEGAFVAFSSSILINVIGDQRETVNVLEALGLTAEQEALYRLLISRPRAAPAELGPAESVERDLAVLAGHGLVSQLSGAPARYVASPPAVALGALLAARREGLRTAELALAVLAEEHRQAASDRAAGDLIEVVTGVEAVRQRFLQIQWTARKRARCFSTAPFVAVPLEENTAEDEGVRRGVEYQVILDREVLAAPGAVAGAIASLRSGVQVRVADSLPIKLMMADSDLALVPLTSDVSAVPAAVVLHRCGLLAALEALFESEWERAYPLRLDSAELVEEKPSPITPMDRQILTLLLAGLTDEAVAGQLGMSLRTLQRRIRVLMDLAGARTRIRLGWHAAERGWA